MEAKWVDMLAESMADRMDAKSGKKLVAMMDLVSVEKWARRMATQ